MKLAIIKRILTPTVVIFYFAMSLLLILTAEDVAGIVIWSGFKPSSGMGLNIIGIIRWNLCVLPPVVSCNLFMIPKIGKLSSFVMLREKSAHRWFIKRCLTVALSTLFYVAVVLLVTTAMGENQGIRAEVLMNFILIFSVHCLLITLASVAVLVLCKSSQSALLLYLIVEGMMVVIGSSTPSISSYLPPFWGMASNSQVPVSTTLVISLLIMCLIVIVTLAKIKRNNPAGTLQTP